MSQIDPSGQRVAVGYYDGTAVSILDATTLAALGKAQTSDFNAGDFRSVAWSHDGATLVAGGNASERFNGEWRWFLRRFDETGLRQGPDIAVSSNNLMDIQPCGEGFAFATYEPSFGLLSAQGDPTILRGLSTAQMMAKWGAAFAVSADASSVRFGIGIGSQQPPGFRSQVQRVKRSGFERPCQARRARPGMAS